MAKGKHTARITAHTTPGTFDFNPIDLTDDGDSDTETVPEPQPEPEPDSCIELRVTAVGQQALDVLQHPKYDFAIDLLTRNLKGLMRGYGKRYIAVLTIFMSGAVVSLEEIVRPGVSAHVKYSRRVQAILRAMDNLVNGLLELGDCDEDEGPSSKRAKTAE